MPTPAEIIDMTASLQNDTAQKTYTDATCLPYLNMALTELQEIFEENNIPVTNEVSEVITVPIGTTSVGFETIPISLPSNLIEIQRIWERTTGIDPFIPMDKVEFIPHYTDGIQYNNFMFWAWINNAIYFPASTQVNDLKLDYIKSLFPLLTINDIEVDLGIRFKNVKGYLGYKTAALCSMYIGENETRAAALEGQAQQAIERSLNISIKGKQVIMTRRRPFRAGYKNRVWE
jgi:hypothetical protein